MIAEDVGSLPILPFGVGSLATAVEILADALLALATDAEETS